MITFPKIFSLSYKQEQKFRNYKARHSIKPMKRIRPHNHRSKGQLMQQKTLKMIEQRAEKEIFFQEVMKRMEKEFDQDQLELFVQNLEVGFQNNLRKKMVPVNQNQFIQVGTEKPIQTPAEQPEDVPFRKLDPAIFENFSKRILPFSVLPNHQEERKYLSTPKIGRKPQKLVLPRKLFDIDTKMKRNYDRIKQRLIMNNGNDSFRAINSIRSSLTIGRQSKTQRVVRFRTQGQQGERSIPRMLMGDLQLKPRERKTDTRGEDRRMECFLSRYKINQ